MVVLLCAATKEEIAQTTKFIQQKQLNKKVDVLITGVGLTAATYHITKSVINKRPELIIQAGVAGSLDPQLNLAETVIIKNEFIGDLGVIENSEFTTVFNLQLTDSDERPWHNSKLVNYNLDQFNIAHLRIVNGVSVNEITTDKNRIRYYKEELNAAIETLEGAALHYIGLMENITFLQIRSVSNCVGERDKAKWSLHDAFDNLNEELKNILLKHFAL